MVENKLETALGADILYDWDYSKMIQVELTNSDDFLKIKETLTRMGVGNKSSSILTQTCHILHQGGKYFICHFKELFRLDGRTSDISLNDIARRNAIIYLLKEWKLLKVINEQMITSKCHLSQICIIPHQEKHLWKLISKHRLGGKK